MHWWVQKQRRLPSEYMTLSVFDKVCIIASVQVKIDEDKKAERETKRGAKGRKTR